MRSLIFKTSWVSSYCCRNVWIRVKMAWTRPRARIKSLISRSATIHTHFLGYEWLPRITAPHTLTALAGNNHLKQTEWRFVQYNSASLNTISLTWIHKSGPSEPMLCFLITCIRFRLLMDCKYRSNNNILPWISVFNTNTCINQVTHTPF